MAIRAQATGRVSKIFWVKREENHWDIEKRWSTCVDHEYPLMTNDEIGHLKRCGTDGIETY